MALTQEYVDSVLGAPKLDRPRPSLKQIKEKVEDTQNVLVGWETVDVLRALDQFYWDVNSAVDAAHDGKVTKGDDWSTGRGKKNKKSQNKQNQKGSNNRSRNSNANQNRGKGNQNQPRQPGAPPGGYQGNQGQRGDGQRPPQRYPRQQQQYQQQQNQQQPQQQNQQRQQQQQRPPQSHQSQPQQRPPQSQQSQSQQRQQPHHQQQRPQQHSHHRNQQQQHQQQQQSQPQQEVYSAQSPSPAASPAPTVPGLQGDWAKRAQMKKIQAQQAAQAPVQPKQLPPQQQQRPSQPQQPPQQVQQAPIPQQEQPPQYEEPENPIPEMDNLQVAASEQPSEDTVEESPVEEEQNEQPEQVDEQPVEEAVEEPVQAEEDEQPQIDLNEIRGSDPLFLAPGLPGDSDAYQFRFGAYGSEEVEEEKEHVAVEEAVVEDSGAVEDQEADSRPVENKPEIATEEQQPTNEDEGSAQGAFEEASGKGQNVGFPGQQGSNFENLDDSSLPQVFYPPYAAQQMPAVFLPPNMQPQQARAGQDPSGAKNAGGVDMTQGMPHLQSHPFPPSPYFSSMYGSHMMGADQQASFPYNPLPSDPNAAMSDPRMRYPMLDQNLGYHPGSFPQQHQSNSSQHGSQHGVEAGGQGQRGSPPINGNAQFGNGNANSNSENPKFSQQQQGMGGAPHDGMNGGLQNSQNTLNLSQHGAQHGAQGEGQQHGAPQMGAHQPPPQPSYPPYFLPPFITQYPPMVHPMRGGPFFKGPPSSFGAPLDVHGSHGAAGAGAQSPFFADQGKGNQQQKHFGHLAESQEGPYEKAQSPQSSTQNQNQQNQGSFQQGGYSGFPMHSFQQPQN